MALLLGIDLGTSYFKVGLFDEIGALKGLGRVAVNKTTPAPQRCELAVAEFWSALRRGLDEAVAQASASAREIVGISYSSQASTFLLLDEQDEPLTPLIVWIDSRGEPVEPEIKTWSHTENFRRTLGSEGLSGQSAPAKWRWWQRHQPAIWAQARRVMTLSDYFTFALTGERVGDASTAAFLACYDLNERRWWPEALARLEIDVARLSEPLRPGASCGRTGARADALLGLPAGIPFAVGALDHHVAAIGSGLERFADLSISTGTVLAALALVDTPTPRPGCFHGSHVDGTRFWRLTFEANGAGQLEAYQRERAPALSIEQLLTLAGQAPAGAAWRPDSRDHGEAVRAILERVTLAHRELVRGVTQGGAWPRRIVATGGGSRSALWLQIGADLLGVPVVTSVCAERACLGAAAFAGVAAGRFASMGEAVSAMVHVGRVFEPEAATVETYRRLGSAL